MKINGKLLSRVNADIDKNPKGFSDFCNQYEPFSVEQILKDDSKARNLSNLYYYSRLEDVAINQTIATFESDLGLQKRS